ncbi:uncharacterized protein TrAFT101_001804 [Trichoderma asperellum]|uniref:uncharacterized protein n=1 Tax=Trichoderma asperellum TaxID=101201 RepID=UPI00331AAB72|nr:hypothetical protein TrAFT101_001804 [Trichoderma asperellum]
MYTTERSACSDGILCTGIFLFFSTPSPDATHRLISLPLLASRVKSHGRRNMTRRKGTKNTFNDIMWRRQNTPRNWQLDNLIFYPFVLLFLFFYFGESVGAAVTAFKLNRRLIRSNT